MNKGYLAGYGYPHHSWDNPSKSECIKIGTFHRKQVNLKNLSSSEELDEKDERI